MTNSRGDVEYIYNTSGTLVTQYIYDAWGNVLTIKDGSGASITSTSHIGNINPIRYRGYYYDVESGLYYLNSRYYDAEVGRFISADGYITTGQGIDSNNMFVYCGNNPVNRVDSTGQFWSEICEFDQIAVNEIRKAMVVMAPAYAGLSVSTGADGPLPFVDAAAITGIVLLTLGTIAYGTYQAVQTIDISISRGKEKEEEKAIAIPDTATPSSTVIYRYYSSKTENLSPRPGKDYDGLSFSTRPPRPGISAVATTIEQVNATGILTAIPTGGTHVIIIPTNGTVSQWMNEGQSSIWSQTLSGIVIEWDGGF